MTTPMLTLSEMPGLYGTFKMEEVILQWIWAEQAFMQDNLSTVCGKKIEVVSGGEWNKSGKGPDFSNARIRLDGIILGGDIEVHFRGKDWLHHGHDQDRNFDRVVLHVTLFPEQGDSSVANSTGGRTVPTLNLLHFLHKGIEEYAEEWTLAKLAGFASSSSRILNLLSKNPCNPKLSARKRWDAKCRFASNRLEASGWEEAVHQWFMEVLGYRRNRLPMAKIALCYPSQLWQTGKIDPEKVYAEQKGWVLQGCRPPNHPRRRLVQYLDLWEVNPNWIADLRKLWLPELSGVSNFSRMSLGISDLSRTVRKDFWKSIFSESRAHTLWLDCCLPLLQAIHSSDLFELWYNWPAGDCPQGYPGIAKSLGWIKGGREEPFSNGHLQAILERLTALNKEAI